MGNVIGVDTSYTGNPVSFVAANGGTMKSISVPLTYTQDLHGYANPWPAGGGKNKLPPLAGLQNYKSLNTGWTWNDNVATVNGITLEVIQKDGIPTGEYKITGTATANTNFYLQRADATPYAGMIMNGIPAGTVSKWEMYYALQASPYTAWGYDTGNGVTLSSSASGTSVLVLRLKNNGQFDDVFTPMFRLATEADATFAPYSNICPISGRTGLSVYRTGKNLLSGDKCINSNNIGLGFSAYTVFKDSVSVHLPVGTYTLSVETADGTTTNLYICKTGESEYTYRATSAKTITFTITEESDWYMYAYKSGYGGVGIDAITSFQLELGSATTYEPYNGNTYSVDWTTQAGTVYGGTLDVVTGVLTVNKAMLTVNTANITNDTYPGWRNVTGLRDIIGAGINGTVNGITDFTGATIRANTTSNNNTIFFNKADLGMTATELIATMPNTDVHFVMSLATPQTFQLTPNHIAALVGQNYIWANNKQTLSVVLTAPMTGFAGWLIKCVTNGTPVEIPLKYMRAETYTVTPDQRMEWSAERDVTGVLHRETVQNLPPKIEFNTPLMTNADINALNSIIKSAFTNYLQRNITIQFYDPERDQYWEWDCYMPDVKYNIRNADTTNHVINYEELRYAFIGY